MEMVPRRAAENLEDEEGPCPICFGAMHRGRNRVRGRLAHLSPCHHKFHEFCIRKWILVQEHGDNGSASCPVCRGPAVTSAIVAEVGTGEGLLGEFEAFVAGLFSGGEGEAASAAAAGTAPASAATATSASPTAPQEAPSARV